QEETGADTHTVVESFLAGQWIYEINEYREELDALPRSIDPEIRWEIGFRLRRLTDRITRWIIHHQRADLTMQQRISSYLEPVTELIPEISGAFVGDTKRRFESDRDRLIEAGFEPQLAVRTSRMFEAYSLMGIVARAARLDEDPKRVIGIFFALHDEFNVSYLLDLISGLSRETRWDSLSRASMREELYSWLTELTGEVLTTEGVQGRSPAEAVAHWESDHLRRVARVRSFLTQIAEQFDAQTMHEDTDLAMMTVVLRRLRSLIL